MLDVARKTLVVVRDRSPGNIKNEFARWMQTRLGYQAVETDVAIGGRGDVPPRIFAVRGETYGIVWQRLRSFAFLAFFVAAVLKNLPSDAHVPVSPNVLFDIAAVAFLAAHIGRRSTRRYTWVELRDRKRPVSTEDVQSVFEVLPRLRSTGAEKAKPAQAIVVAGSSGFRDEALTLASSMGIECYRRTESGFERTSSGIGGP